MPSTGSCGHPGKELVSFTDEVGTTVSWPYPRFCDPCEKSCLLGVKFPGPPPLLGGEFAEGGRGMGGESRGPVPPPPVSGHALIRAARGG